MSESANGQSQIALCLSGGGFRAALFHLGALRRLHELGLLQRIDTISSVSGGSIIAAHLAERIASLPTGTTTFGDWEHEVAQPFRRLVRHNLRSVPLLRRMLPTHWMRSGVAVAALEEGYRQHLTARMLGSLPPRPHFIFCATDMTFGVNWTFDRERFGDWQAGYSRAVDDVPVARAVAASSCFPPLFGPQAVPQAHKQLKGGAVARHPQREMTLRGLRLTDGGVYDNLALEPVWKRHEVVLVSDGGSPFSATSNTPWWFRLRRYVELVGKQGAAIRKRWLLASFQSGSREGAYWGIGTTIGDAPGYGKDITALISNIRTDLDAFDDAESSILENHGYLVADATLRKHATGLIPIVPPPVVPHPRWLDERAVARALARSDKVRLLGRF